MNARRLAMMIVAAALALAGCASADESAGDDAGESEPVAVASEPAPAESEPAAAESETAAAPAGGEIAVASSDLGDILVDAEGMVLYVFDNDTDETSTCYDDCEANWPPLTGEATAGDGVDESLLGTSEREDGSTQVTYAGHPLYYFAGDQSPGDTNGQALNDVWWVVGPDGEGITSDAAASGGDESSDGY